MRYSDYFWESTSFFSTTFLRKARIVSSIAPSCKWICYLSVICYLNDSVTSLCPWPPLWSSPPCSYAFSKLSSTFFALASALLYEKIVTLKFSLSFVLSSTLVNMSSIDSKFFDSSITENNSFNRLTISSSLTRFFFI